MHVGLLTAPFRSESFEHVARWSGENGFAALEVTSGPGAHIDPERDVVASKVKGGAAVRKLIDESGVRISALAYYGPTLDADAAKRASQLETVKSVVRAAEKLSVDVVCLLAGMPVAGKSKMETIESECGAYFGEIAEYAGERGINIALENWFATNIQHLDHWKRLFEVVPAGNFGLNFDPSHLYWQGIDHIGAVSEFAERIFHTHAKDCRVADHLLRRVGCLEGGWWRYVIPGFGGIDWGQYTSALRSIGYDGVLSIEHEDPWLGREEGFRLGREHLERFC